MMQMDGLGSCKQLKQACIMPLNLSATVQKNANIPIAYLDIDGLVLKSGRANGYDLERGITVTEEEAPPFLELIKKFFGKIRYRLSWLSLTLIVNASEDDNAGNNIIQCGAVQERNAKLGFLSHQNTVESSTVTAVTNQSEDMGLAKGMDTLSGCSEKAKDGNVNSNLKSSWKKPPRPPRRARDASRERYMNSISGSSLRRKARLERMKSARNRKFAKPSSEKTSFWALFVTLSFGVIMITQGMFSQGTGTLQNLSPKSGQASQLFMHNFTSPVSNNESAPASSIGQNASAFSLSTSRKMRNKGYSVG